MVAQKPVNLNEPLDVNTKATLGRSELTPDLAEASLTLHGDYYRQLQGKCNRHIFWHPSTVAILVGGIGTFLYHQLSDWIQMAGSWQEFAGFVLTNNGFRFDLMKVFPFLIGIVSAIGIVAYFISDVFRVISDKLPLNEYFEQIYGFDLRKFAKLGSNELTPKEKKIYHADYSHIIIYRGSPIAEVTLKPLIDNSTDANFIVKITGLHVRKVFTKVDFETLLLEWSIVKSRQMFHHYAKSDNVDGCKITLLIDAYSFDQHMKSVLNKSSFQLLSSTFSLDPFKEVAQKAKPNASDQDPDRLPTIVNKLLQILSNKVMRLTRDTYGITFIAKNADEDILLQVSEQHKGSLTPTTNATTTTKRQTGRKKH